MPELTTTIFLTPPDAELFKKFQKHHDIFKLLVEQGAFDIQFGKVTLNFAGGLLQSIAREEVKKVIHIPINLTQQLD